ncbi:MAG: CPBP family intramembrane metalloprotease [Nocardioides sp.]|nr:CPBP family intramembrane metalloprotease [Nocardioides sp.]
MGGRARRRGLLPAQRGRRGDRVPGGLLSALTDVLGVRMAVVLQAVAFGALHLHGVPSGPVGIVMAGAWGLLLGVMRVRSRGLLAPYVTHLAADATIVLLMLPALTA